MQQSPSVPHGSPAVLQHDTPAAQNPTQQSWLLWQGCWGARQVADRQEGMPPSVLHGPVQHAACDAQNWPTPTHVAWRQVHALPTQPHWPLQQSISRAPSPPSA